MPKSALGPTLGHWTSPPGRIVDLAADLTTVALAEVPDVGQPMRVHVGTRVAGQWRWLEPWTVPRPPSVRAEHNLEGTSARVEIDVSGADDLALAINRVEYQGGSHGIALARARGGVWIDPSEIPSPTDSDIAFGIPPLRRGDELFTTEFEDRLWHYVRIGNAWKPRELPLPRGASFTYDPAMCVTRDRSELAIAVSRDGGSPHVLILQRRQTGDYRLAQSLPMPGFVNALAYADKDLYIGFAQPNPEDSSVLWVASLGVSGRREVNRRIRVPAPIDPHRDHLVSLDVSDDWVLVVGPDEVWALRRSDPEGDPCPLELPARVDDRLRHPRARLLGHEAVVLVDGKLGVFGLE
jgi:hypothetical protein